MDATATPATAPSVALDAALLARVEEAGLNASAPPAQRLVGGWLVRLSPGKAKRARCVNAVATPSEPLAQLLGRIGAVYREAGLPLIVRITPFSHPRVLDTLLALRGWRRFDDTRVMVCADLGAAPLAALPLPPGCTLDSPGHGGFAEAVGRLRNSPLAQREAHAERLRGSAVPYRGVLLKGADGELLACAQIATEGDLVGLYDVYTAPAHRGRGHARWLCTRLLLEARAAGARSAYLQVDADNAPARAIYAALGFIDGYAYHYRSQDPEAV
ncbi:GNAT family N-acetyltransferase [Rivibacter subsaxonicus]|uniref:Acetyltransferase (GNAT) family protein n=1 Tax=Rivibacter subsaxonicus TaxID=457575 RepID=A0A4Q7VW95_9BURK|nr:GNAT family N-acetyltransferase [Rivibacter subsaxonicus]RZU00863.1 acetyltransferase (GNAT) family protein [Rivibacter subsaxonicus]